MTAARCDRHHRPVTAPARRRRPRSAATAPSPASPITNPGSGYTAATVSITGAGTGATANAVVTTSGTVTAVTVDRRRRRLQEAHRHHHGRRRHHGRDGHRLRRRRRRPARRTPAAATRFPTVDFDTPDDPNGTQATAHATSTRSPARSPAIVVDNPGSGYSPAPNVVIRDGTLMDPIINGGAGASATATLKVLERRRSTPSAPATPPLRP